MGDGKMGLPELVYYETESEYFEHYKRVYCRDKVYTFDGIRVFFDPKRFLHAFYKDDKYKQYGGSKSKFCKKRAEHINWIKYVLTNEESILYQGYNERGGILPERRVAVISKDKYVVILNMFLNNNGDLCARFNTAFCAEKSFKKITQSPLWNMDLCKICLKNKKGADSHTLAQSP